MLGRGHKEVCLRRVGKTTTMFQLIDGLLESKGVSPYNVLYFSFDEERADIKEILASYEREIIREDLPRDRKTYLFLDEVQKLEVWPGRVKVIYDMYPNVKLCLSGSAAINISKGVRESLAGRFFETRIEPLDFDEYLEFSGDDIDRKKEKVFELRIRRRLDEFMANGGFIEALELSEAQRSKYFKEGLLERVIYRATRGYMISDNAETSFSDGDKSVDVIPYWMHWTLMGKLGGHGSPD